MLLGLAPPADECIGVLLDCIGVLLDPSVPWDPLPLWEVIPTSEPTAELIFTKAWRSGGTAKATPMANATQATARADPSSPSRQSRGRRRA